MQILRYLNTLGSVLALVPVLSPTFFKNLYQISLIIFVAVSNCFCIVTTIRRGIEEKWFGLIFLVFELVYAFLAIATITNMVMVTGKKRQKYKKLYNFLLNYLPNRTQQKSLRIKVYLMQTATFCLVAIQLVTVLSILGQDLLVLNLPKQANTYFFMAETLILFGFAWEIAKRFEQVHLLLIRIPMTRLSDLQIEKSGREIVRVRSIFQRVIEMMALFNEVFGWSVLMTASSTIVGIIELASFISLVVTLDYSIWSVFGYILVHVASYLVALILLATCGSKIEQEICSINKYSLRCLLDLNASNSTERNLYRMDIRNELQLFLLQSSSSSIQLSAARFFTVNLSFVLEAISVVNTYTIIFLQLYFQ